MKKGSSSSRNWGQPDPNSAILIRIKLYASIKTVIAVDMPYCQR